MDQIWAPWRMEFVRQGGAHTECFLCQKPKENQDESNYVLYRGKLNYILLNAYPYNPAHMMVSPYRHVGKLEDTTEEELREHFELVRFSVRILNHTVKPTGCNVGMNLGRVAGAGVDDHIHTHVVPRWQGDTNFMPIVSQTKVLSEALQQTYAALVEGIKVLLK
jgi:ATP adenylyltransferase